jgi:DMSO/TMAO reductase YedYZ molybdopterin-dependent catalytic subunit
MLVVMPVTGAGVFASALLVHPLLTDAGYLLVFLGYACVLIADVALSARVTAPGESRIFYDRRALLAGIVGAVAAGALAALVGRDGGATASALPLAAVPTAVVPTPAPTSQVAPQPAATSAATPEVASTPTPVPLPDPPPARRLARDKDGALTAAGRPRGQLAPAITSNEDFYVVTKNAVEDPAVDAATWRLVVDGEVNVPVQLDYRTLLALPPVDLTKTLECISNFTAACNLTSFGCDLVSTARVRGARLSDVLALAGGLKSTAVGLAFVSIDEFSAGLPVELANDPNTLIVYSMNGQPLPREHGFPARLLVPGRYGMKNPKWLVGIRAMTREYAGWYEQRNWNKDGIVKTMSRIDTPEDGARLSPGEQSVAGIAYAGDRGISLVEVSIGDGEPWLPATVLEPMPGTDAMVRWQTTFTMPARGAVTLTVRATDGTGQVQTDVFQLPQPDGASGRHSITVLPA